MISKTRKAVFMLSFMVHLEMVFSATQSCTPIDECSCKMVNGKNDGKEVSLHQIDKHNSILFPSINDGYNFKVSYNPCKPFNRADNCHDVLACQYVPGGDTKQTFPLATPDSAVFGVDESTGSAIFTYSATTTVNYQKTTRTLNIMLICDPTVETPRTSSVTEGPATIYSMELTHKCACPGMCSSSSPSSDKSLSVGSILCILLLVFCIVYLIGGIVFLKYYKKEEGSNIFPNREFWMDLPPKIKAGCHFSYSKVKRKGGDEYETI